jgi:hypothetical protein
MKQKQREDMSPIKIIQRNDRKDQRREKFTPEMDRRSLEEREAAYEAARARIFDNQTEWYDYYPYEETIPQNTQLFTDPYTGLVYYIPVQSEWTMPPTTSPANLTNDLAPTITKPTLFGTVQIGQQKISIHLTNALKKWLKTEN